MTFVPEGFIGVAHEWDLPVTSRSAITTYGTKNDALDTPEQAAQIIHGAMALVSGAWPIATSLIRTKVYVGTAGEPLVGEYAQSFPGGEGGEQSYLGASILVRKITGTGGRKHRGRMFLPWVTEVGTGPGGVLTSTRLTDLNTSMTTFFNALATADQPMYLLHTDENLPPTEVTSLSVQSVIATQRRRQR